MLWLKQPLCFYSVATICLITQAAKNGNFIGQQWVIYDRQFWREALARKDLNWSVTYPHLYNEAFTGRARAIARCSFCLQDDHTDAYCPKNPNHPLFSWYPSLAIRPTPTGWPSLPSLPFTNPGPSPKSLEICRCYNKGRCKQSRCRYQHACSFCHAPHPLVGCPQCPGLHTQGRSRSPARPMPRGPLPGPC